MTTHAASTVGQILDVAFTVYRRHFAVLAGTVSIVLLPALLLESFGGSNLTHLRALWALLAAVVTTAQTSDALLGRSPTLLGGFHVGMRRLLPALLSLAFLVVAAAAATLPFAAILWLTQPRFSGLTPSAFGLAAVCVACSWAIALSWLGLRYFAVLQVATLEPGASPPDRSASLARGAYGTIALVWLIGGVLYAVPAVLIGGAQGLVSAMRDHGQAPLSLVVLGAVLGWSVTSLIMPFTSALGTALYYSRRASADDAPMLTHMVPDPGHHDATPFATEPSR